MKLLPFKLFEQEQESHAVVAFGRMNPPTTGHSALVHAVRDHANSLNADPHVYLSHSQDAKKNPLPYEKKLEFVQRSFGDVVKRSDAKSPLDVLKSLHGKYHHVTFVAGSDRVDEFKNLLHKYNGKEGHYNFKSINVVSAGHRNPDDEGVAGMSASKMRGHATSGDHESFKAGLPDTLKPHSKEVMSHVKRGMQLDEKYAVVYARVPPKPAMKGPIPKENKSGVLEYLKQLVVGIQNKNVALKQNPNRKANDKIVGMYAGDSSKNENALSESYEFNIAKPAGYGTFLTAGDLGIAIKGSFAHHPTVVEAIKNKKKLCNCGCGFTEQMHEELLSRFNNKKGDKK